MKVFAIEFASSDPNYKGYGNIHKAGCRDLRDPEEFQCEPTQEAIDAAANDLTGWEENGHYTLSPCAKAMLEDHYQVRQIPGLNVWTVWDRIDDDNNPHKDLFTDRADAVALAKTLNGN